MRGRVVVRIFNGIHHIFTVVASLITLKCEQFVT